MNIIYDAMTFAMEAHKNQLRKYTNEPYWVHLAEVAGIVGAVAPFELHDTMVAVAWLHDTVEDCAVSPAVLEVLFSKQVAEGVLGLTDNETGKNRAERKAKSRERLSQCADWIQTIKCADIISNTSSIAEHDPTFSVLYLEEKRLLLDVMDKADHRLRRIALEQCSI